MQKDLIMNYEDLRNQALGLNSKIFSKGHGLNLILRKGMVSWLEAWNICSKPIAIFQTQSENISNIKVPNDLQGQVSMILADIALQVWKKEEDDQCN